MKGHPKYNYNDTVWFSIAGKPKKGTIFIIDKYGTFEDDSDVSYDVMVKDEHEECLYKHIREDFLRADE